MPSRSELAAMRDLDSFLDSDLGQALADLPAQQEAAETEAISVPPGPPSESAASLLREELIEPPHEWTGIGYDEWATDSGREGGE